MSSRPLTVCLLALLVAACTSPTIKDPSPSHLRADAAPAAAQNLPQPVTRSLTPPPPKPAPKTETYSVVVNNVRVHDLLFALARDARINVDIHPGINGNVTLNAIDQTLPQLLNRIAKQVDMRFEIDGPNLAVMPDTPFLRNYRVDYVNMSRDTAGSVTVNTQLVGIAAGGTGAPTIGAGSNNSTTKVENKAQHHFWDTLIQNIKDILRETDKEIVVSRRSAVSQEQTSRQGNTTASSSGAGSVAAAGSQAGSAVAGAGNQTAKTQADATQAAQTEKDFKDFQTVLAASVIAHPETGILSVRANARQHEKVQEFLDKVQVSARRQVMIEATIVEVQLSNNYQQGIDWSKLPLSTGLGFGLQSKTFDSTQGLFTAQYKNDRFSSAIKLLDDFGTTKVLSSPKISVLNNQTAVLKVVDNEVYFTIKADTSQNQTTTVITYTTTLHQVPVGFVMNVTPQISESDTVLLNVRPSVSRIVGTVQDPNPALRKSTTNNFTEDIKSEIPIIRMREMESMLRVQDGNIAVMGGLMEDHLQNRDQSVPGLGRIPLLGELFNQRDDTARKTELVVFLRPTIIRDPSISGDFSSLREHLPKGDFFTSVPDPQTPGDKVEPFRGAR
ncbi:MAG: type II and III secretion system protein [Rhodocyclales bacterium]|nr:type II and III secretion system protein [Rhodocyclales bacterium]